jgi:predicted transcriptional regulator
MRTTSIKLSPDMDRRLTDLARHRKTTRSAIVREALEAFGSGAKSSVASAAADLAGSLNGPPDLSTADEHMLGYGR